MKTSTFRYLALGAFVVAGCVSADLSKTTRVDVDDDRDEGGITSADIRTVASKMCPEILSVPEVGEAAAPVRIKVADVQNTSRFFIDRNLFARRLRMELNRYAEGQVRFLDKNEKSLSARTSVLKDRQEDCLKRDIRGLGAEIGGSALFRDAARPMKVAVVPVLNANLVNMNADSFAAMLRSEIVNASGGKAQFLMPGHTEGADYWLTGQFYPVSMKKEGIVNLAEYIDVVDARVRDGKSLYLDTGFAASVTPVSTTVVATDKRESVLLEMLRNPELRANPNVEKQLDVMIVKPDDKVCVFEKNIVVDRRISDNSGKAALILSGEISGLSHALNGKSSDYVLITFHLTDPETNEIVWENGYEVKRVSRAGVVYR